MAGDAVGAAELAAFLRGWADVELARYCPLYERIARRLAEDEALLGRVAGVGPREKMLPVLLFAAVKSIADREPGSALARVYAGEARDPWPPFRALLDDRFDEIAHRLRTRRIQTNEVGRSAALLPALALAHARLGRPLALVELGPSAGLNLLLDRFAYDYGGGAAGDPASGVRISCELRGPLRPPLPAVPPIAARCGIDLNPVDVRDEEQRRWLEACVWPGAPERVQRLRAALALAQAEPPRLHRGDALALLPAVLHEVPAQAVPCIVSTWMLAYVAEPARRALAAAVASVAERRDVACVTVEYPGVSPWSADPDRPPVSHDEGVATVLGLSLWSRGTPDGRALAWMHAHGSWLEWVDAASALPTTA